MFIPAKYKECYLVYLLNELAGNTAILFVSTCMNALRYLGNYIISRITLMLRNLGFEALAIHG
jgi:ATP-dependent RNA helicase DDX47/RRP3